jgi:hypothetical protein
MFLDYLLLLYLLWDKRRAEPGRKEKRKTRGDEEEGGERGEERRGREVR